MKLGRRRLEIPSDEMLEVLMEAVKETHYEPLEEIDDPTMIVELWLPKCSTSRTH